MSAEAPATIHWFRSGEKLEEADPRIAWATGAPPPEDDPEPDPEPPMPMAEREMRVEFTTIVRTLCDEYEIGNIDVMLVGFIDQTGRPIPILGPMPNYAVTDALALSDILHSTTRQVVNQRLQTRTEP